jgi:asparaginyl-tRNA synthetase
MRQDIVERLADTGKRISNMRTPEMVALAKVEAAMLAGARKAFERGGYTEISVPHLTRATGACENFDTLFETDYFGSPAYLSQTGQLYLEAFVPELDRVCCIGPSFRAEPKADDRHLTEFTLLEIELQCDLAQLRTEIEQIIFGMTSEAIGKTERELESLGVNTNDLAEKVIHPFPVMSYTDAVKALQKEYPELKWGDDLRSQHERTLVEYAGNMPLFVTHFPQGIKFFNMRVNRENNTVVNSMDLLLPYGGEAVGSAEREEDAGILEKRLRESSMVDRIIARKSHDEWKGMSYDQQRDKAIELFRWYIDFVKQNPVRHAGCGIGGTRVMQFLLESPDIRASTAYALNRESIL